MSDILITVHSLEKHFAARQIFSNLSFAVETGQKIGLIGANGSGKSTLLKILAGLVEPDGGKMSPARGLQLGYLPQTPTFEPGINVHDAIAAQIVDYEKYALIDSWISKLSLTPYAEREVVSLSGGWQKRVALACELVKEPQLLMLDEPTNHLDLSAILWLEKFLRDAEFAVLTITHDKLFLERVADRIFDIDGRWENGFRAFTGDYVSFMEQKDEFLLTQSQQLQVKKNKMRRETEWLRRGAKARQTKSQSRIDRAHELDDQVSKLNQTVRKKSLDLSFEQNEKRPKKFLEAVNISQERGGRTLFSDVNLLLGPQARVGLLGDNGVGKTTLIQTLLGNLPPKEGIVKSYVDLDVSYFEQGRDTLDQKLSLVKQICPDGDHVQYRGTPVYARSYLSRFLFRPEQMEMPVGRLSGGEQARLRIAQMMLNPANLLVLDEPTNDLDSDTLEVLQNCLTEFDGAVILVTHDRFFMDQVVNQLLYFELDDNGRAQLISFANYFQWEEWYEQKQQLLSQKAAQSSKKSDSKNEKGKGKTKLSFKETHELSQIEGVIQAKEADLEKTTALVSDPVHASNPQKLKEITQKMSNLEVEIQKLYARWAELEGKA